MTDIRANRVTATGTVFSGRSRVKGVSWAGAAGTPTIVLRDGGASGTVRCTLDGVASSNGGVSFEGDLLFETDVHATLTNITGLTVFHDG